MQTFSWSFHPTWLLFLLLVAGTESTWKCARTRKPSNSTPRTKRTTPEPFSVGPWPPPKDPIAVLECDLTPRNKLHRVISNPIENVTLPDVVYGIFYHARCNERFSHFDADTSFKYLEDTFGWRKREEFGDVEWGENRTSWQGDDIINMYIFSSIATCWDKKYSKGGGDCLIDVVTKPFVIVFPIIGDRVEVESRYCSSTDPSKSDIYIPIKNPVDGLFLFKNQAGTGDDVTFKVPKKNIGCVFKPDLWKKGDLFMPVPHLSPRDLSSFFGDVDTEFEGLPLWKKFQDRLEDLLRWFWGNRYKDIMHFDSLPSKITNVIWNGDFIPNRFRGPSTVNREFEVVVQPGTQHMLFQLVGLCGEMIIYTDVFHERIFDGRSGICVENPKAKPGIGDCNLDARKCVDQNFKATDPDFIE